jgi:endonuclease/exonuclease/phosphatase (EEP) superfamily protein YafD
VLTAGGWHAERAVVGPDLGSDHRPLVVRLWRAGA